MEALVASAIGIATAAGIYLILRGRTFPVVIGLSLLGYAVNFYLFAMGRLTSGHAPILRAEAAGYADPLPQALVLTAIVIGFAMTGYLVELALRAWVETGSDHVDAGRRPPGFDPQPDPDDPIPGHDDGVAEDALATPEQVRPPQESAR